MKHVIIHELSVPVEESREPLPALRNQLKKKYLLGSEDYTELDIIRRAIDARRKQPLYVFSVAVTLNDKNADRLLKKNQASLPKKIPQTTWQLPQHLRTPQTIKQNTQSKLQTHRPIIIGAGPAGLFAALTLAEAGLPPLLIERGDAVKPRARKVSELYRKGVLDEDSNVCFGEGGAGTFSDGKLYTRIGDTKVQRLIDRLISLGGPPDIAINTRPHLGTDKLVALLQNLRQRLLSLGCIIQFNSTLTSLNQNSNGIHSVTLRNGEELPVSHLVLATGHSAHEVWRMVENAGVMIEPRAFAVGFRIEHPQPLIDAARYGALADHELLPAADYSLRHQAATNSLGSASNSPQQKRGVYSFCMCPGGVVVPTPTQQNELCINGMSHAARSGRYANSAMVVTVTPEDFAQMGYHGTYAGLEFQKAMEQRAYEMGGGDFVAPAQRVADFIEGKLSPTLNPSSYRRGLNSTHLDDLYPPFITDALRQALPQFSKKIPGFVTNEATLIGVETRTASPIRVPRDTTGQIPSLQGVFPAGEGMGYGGGIVSAAVDGMRAAENLLRAVGAVETDAGLDSL